MASNSQYKMNYLKQVIVRVDFVSPITEIGTDLPGELAKAALKRFPISEPQKGFTVKGELSQTGTSVVRKDFTQWQFFGKDRNKILMLNPQFVAVTYSHYESYEPLKKDFLDFITELLEDVNSLQSDQDSGFDGWSQEYLAK